MQHYAAYNLTGLDSIPGDSQVTQLTSIRSFPPRLQTPGFPACLERNSACTSRNGGKKSMGPRRVAVTPS